MAEPSTFEVRRSTVISAPVDRIHPLINDFHEWLKWSPWEGMDQEMKRDYSGPAAGTGAAYAWAGNRKAGAGRMEITGSAPTRIDVDLDFTKPMKTHNLIAFDLEPKGAATEVSWTMRGTQTGIWRVIGKVYPMDKLVGKDFEKGLAQLKTAAETAPGD